jgi:hypothetical protein
MPTRVVRPETKKLNISDGDWLLVKQRLNHGEQDAAFARRYIVDGVGPKANLLQQTGMAKVTAYLLDWSLTDLEEKPLVIRDQPIEDVESCLNAIDPESFDEILAAINAHEIAMDLQRAQEKKSRAGVTDVSAISESRSAPAGPSTTSEGSTSTTTRSSSTN